MCTSCEWGRYPGLHQPQKFGIILRTTEKQTTVSDHVWCVTSAWCRWRLSHTLPTCRQYGKSFWETFQGIQPSRHVPNTRLPWHSSKAPIFADEILSLISSSFEDRMHYFFFKSQLYSVNSTQLASLYPHSCFSRIEYIRCIINMFFKGLP